MAAKIFSGTEMPDAQWWEALWPDPARVLSECGLNAGARAVDLCAGDGWFTLSMARMSRQVTAIDIDGRLLALCRRRLAQAGLANCRFVQADAYELAKTVSGLVDFVFLANVFHGVPDRGLLCSIVARVLAPNGRFAVVNWQPRPREETTALGAPRGPRSELRMSTEAVQAAVEPSGLALMRIVELPPYHYAAIFQKPAAPAADA